MWETGKDITEGNSELASVSLCGGGRPRPSDRGGAAKFPDTAGKDLPARVAICAGFR